MATDSWAQAVGEQEAAAESTAAFVLAMLSHVDPNNKFPQGDKGVSNRVDFIQKLMDNFMARFDDFTIGIVLLLLIQDHFLVTNMTKLSEEAKQLFGLVGVASLQMELIELQENVALKEQAVQRGTQLQEQVVIGKPGTMLDWCLKFKFIAPPKKIKVFVLDEADVMICYTGTPGPEHTHLKTPNIIKLKREEGTQDTIKQYYVVCHSKEEKFMALCDIYGAITIAQAMIFYKAVGWLAGIDVEQVSVVLNFDLPVDRDGDPDNETYLHRLGRTGRFGKRELAINMVDSKFSMNVLNKIQDHFNKKIEKLDTDDLDEIEKIAS
ncbi:ATP-dependent RNA helicase DDX19B-like [Oncorhynchus clarkii lewisi]|uniref:ATP-dependent RNA helicase DDX19B-like n=1 Tax=Oncorhynchus clarkii lewisi TaxID=490388 RepID=UPI0039B8B5A1